MTTKNKTQYRWNLDKLAEAKQVLESKVRSFEEEKEYMLLCSLLESGDQITGFAYNDDVSFSEKFKGEFITLFMDYYQYLNYIFDFFDGSDQEIEAEQLFTFNTNEDEILAATHDFFKGYDDEWFRYFNKIYKQKDDFLSFETIRPFSAYLHSSGIWIANINKSNTVADYVDTVHEYAHGIADQIAPGIKTYSPDSILLEVFPLVTQMIFMCGNNISMLQSEISKYLNNYFKEMVSLSEEVLVKFNIAETFCSVKNARCLSRLVRRTWGFNMRKEEAQSLYATPIEANINYVFPFIVALELLDIYHKDPDKYKFLMKKMLVAEDHPLDTLKRLEIVPNSRLKK